MQINPANDCGTVPSESPRIGSKDDITHRIKGTVHPENDQNKKKAFLLLMKYQYVADVALEVYSCAT